MEPSLKVTALGKYNLIASLAEGGMAKVYLGLMAGPAGFNKLLVIKVLNRDDVAENAEDNVQLFWDEARLAARVIHPNIVHTYEVGEVDGRYFLAMEYLDGQSYRSFQTRLGKSNQAMYEELRIISETARGLHYAHELQDFKGEPLGVVHRDVSPQNVFVTYDGQVKLLDFGIAKTYDAGHKTQVGVIKGKLDYIAPEQLSGDNVDHRADIFALGIMLYEAVTGQRFAGGRKVAEVTKIHARLIGSEAKVRALKPDIDEALAVIIDRAVALDPAKRWSDAGAFADALDAYIESTGRRPTAKGLSELMNKLFAEERRTMHKLIDQQIEARASQPVGGNTGNLPHLGWNNTFTPSGVRDVDRDLEGTNSARGIPLLVEPPKPAVSSRRFLGVAVVASVTLLLALAWLVPQREIEPRANASAPNQNAEVTQEAVAIAPPAPGANVAEPAGDVPQEASEKATVVIKLKTWPADARVTLDGAEVPVPFAGEFRRGSALHHLEATAKGYQPYKKLIDYSRDQSIDIVLQQQVQGRSRRGGSRADNDTQPPPPVAPQPEVVAAPPQPEPAKPPTPGADIEFVKPRLKPTEIDIANPYSKKK